MRVYVNGQRRLWVDPANWFRLGELKYIGPAGHKTRKALGLGGK
jgi:hypothetical protein